MNNHPYCHVACGGVFIIRPIIGAFLQAYVNFSQPCCSWSELMNQFCCLFTTLRLVYLAFI